MLLAAPVGCMLQRGHTARTLKYTVSTLLVSCALPSSSSTQLLTHSLTLHEPSTLSHYLPADIIGNLVDPSMGKPLATEEEIRVKHDTSTWAFDPVTGEHYFNWMNVTEMQYGFGRYNNPEMTYQAPLLHTVELTSLAAGQDYFYRVSDSCTIFHFRMPQYFYSDASAKQKGAVFPFSIGLTGDVGQTEVSLKSMEALAALEADAVLLVGDLSYADGYGPSWDSFGRAFEALASQVPVLTTGGNHEVSSRGGESERAARTVIASGILRRIHDYLFFYSDTKW